MIRINLLPYRVSKKKEAAQQQLTILSAIIVVALMAMGAIYIITAGKLKATKSEITRSENELADLKKKIGEIDNLKKLQADVQKKLDILNQLRKEKTGPAMRLARLSDIVPEKMWLTKYQESGAAVAISGFSYSEDNIADFMRSIQSSSEFMNVELQVSEQQELNGVKLKKFDISCVLKVGKKEETPKADPTKTVPPQEEPKKK
jgi:type IV pilus assembly protein PilN